MIPNWPTYLYLGERRYRHAGNLLMRAGDCVPGTGYESVDDDGRGTGERVVLWRDGSIQEA